MDLQRVARETVAVLASYLTYQAVRVVIDQLSETNPPMGLWLRQFSTGDRLQDGEAYLNALLREKPDLALRVMSLREHLSDRVADFLPGMLRESIQKNNVELRRQLLERITQTRPTSGDSSPDATHPELDANDPSD